MPLRNIRVLLDANVIVDAQLRDLFLTMAELDLIDLRWTDEILREVERALTSKLAVAPERVRHLLAVLDTAFEDATVRGHEARIETLDLPDPDDRHVLAAAEHAECDFLITNNVKDFPAGCTSTDVEVLSADEGLFLLATTFRDRIEEVVERIVARLRRPPTSRQAYLDRLAQHAPRGAAAIGASLGEAPYDRLFEDIVFSQTADTAHGAVSALLEAIGRSDVESIMAAVDPGLSRSLTGAQEPDPPRLAAALRSQLADMYDTDGWGIATARRVHGPDEELVKYVRGGSEVRIVFDPEYVHGHLFRMRYQDGSWILMEIDGRDPADDQ